MTPNHSKRNALIIGALKDYFDDHLETACSLRAERDLIQVDSKNFAFRVAQGSFI